MKKILNFVRNNRTPGQYITVPELDQLLQAGGLSLDAVVARASEKAAELANQSDELFGQANELAEQAKGKLREGGNALARALVIQDALTAVGHMPQQAQAEQAAA